MSLAKLPPWVSAVAGIALGTAWHWIQRYDGRLVLPALALLLSGLALASPTLREPPRVRPSGRIALRRLPGRTGGARLITLLTWLAVAALGLWAELLTPESIGASTRVHPLLALGAGAAVYGVLSGAAVLAVRGLGIADQLEDRALHVMALLVPRDRGDKALGWIALVLLNPVAEELVFRGILVHHVGHLTGYVAPAVALGLVANAANHAYQGLRLQPYHVAAYACAVGLLYSPVGLLGAIGFHFLADLVPVSLMRRDLRRYRARHRPRAAQPPSRSQAVA